MAWAAESSYFDRVPLGSGFPAGASGKCPIIEGYGEKQEHDNEEEKAYQGDRGEKGSDV